MLKIPSLLLFAALMAAAAAAQGPSGRAASSRDIEIKVALENVIEKRLETVLRKVLASDDILVVANVDLLADSDRPDVEVLPGVVVKKTPSTPAPMELPASLVKRVTLSVFLPQATTDENIELARTTAERMVGLKTERGDALNVEKVRAAPEKTAPAASFLDKALTPGTILLLVWLLAACWALIHISGRFLDPLLTVLREGAKNLAAGDAQRAGTNQEAAKRETAAPVAPEAVAQSGAKDPDERKLPFSFIKERDLPALELLLSEQADVTAAIIVQYLPPALSAKVLSKLAPSRREMVLAYMTKPAMINQYEVKKIEEAILSKIDYIMGGEEKLVSMLDQATVGMQTEILETVRRRDPELGQRLDSRVIVIDDIGLLDEAGLTALSRHATVRGMAIVLKALPHLREKVLAKLKTGLGEWLAQETSLISDLPEQVKEAEMRLVLQAIIRLSREGKIVLRKTAPPLPVVAETPAAPPEWTPEAAPAPAPEWTPAAPPDAPLDAAPASTPDSTPVSSDGAQ